jgi:predicted metal-binding membrane protein
VYQFTSLKDRCLRQCRTPLGFLLNEWRPGGRGAVVMGLRHGALCVGCCWALMALLFVLGVMNLLWIALVAAVVLVEKLVPSTALTKVLGAALIVWGIGLTAGLGS